MLGWNLTPGATQVWKNKTAEEPRDRRAKRSVREPRRGEMKIGRLGFQKVVAGELLRARQEARCPRTRMEPVSWCLGRKKILERSGH